MTEHYYAEHPESELKYGLIRTCLRGRQFEFVTASSVFSVKRIDIGTRVLIESMQLPIEGCTLDIGCGYGAVGIVAARLNPKLHVVMTDVNRRAVLLARQNAERNSVYNVEVKHGAFYEPVEGMWFESVLSNPPVSAGMQTVETIIRNAPRVMASKGTLQMVVRSKIGKKTLPDVFEETFGNCSVIARESGYRVLMAEKTTAT